MNAVQAPELTALAQRYARHVTNSLVEEQGGEQGAPPVGGWATRERADALITALLEEHAFHALTGAVTPLTEQDEAWVHARALADVCGLGPLELLLTEPGVRDIHVTGTRVWVNFGDGGREERPAITESDEELVALVQRLAAQAPGGERRFDLAAPLLSMELEGGARLSAVMGVSRRPAVTIRRHPEEAFTLSDLISSGMLTPEVGKFLSAGVRARLNLVIGGATGSGKTTLLRALARSIEPTEHVITIEDARELNLDTGDMNVLALQSRPPNTEGAGELTASDLVRHALRMSPDRVIVGETRGPETVALLHAMTMGTDGSLATVHASSSSDIFGKLSTYISEAREQWNLEGVANRIASAVHLALHIETDLRGNGRVASIREVTGAEGTRVISNELYSLQHGFVTAPSPEYARKLDRVGFDPSALFGGFT